MTAMVDVAGSRIGILTVVRKIKKNTVHWESGKNARYAIFGNSKQEQE